MIKIGSIFTVFKREMAAYFNSAIAYIFIIVFVLLNAGLFMTQFFLIGRADMRPVFSTIPFLLAVFIPAITMRQWAEEKRGNTLELLLTFPLPTYVLVVGKFLAAFAFYVITLLSTCAIPLMVSALGNPDMGVIFSGYLGAIFLGAFFLAIGIFISGLCHDQIVAFILSMIVCFGLHLLGTEFLATSIDGWLPGFGSLLRRFVGSAGHFDAFVKGVVDNRDLLYFILGTGIFIGLNAVWFEGRMKPGYKRIFSTSVVICAGIFLMTNWLFASISIGRFDLTEANLYTISPATKKIIRALKAPVTAKLYISPMDKMPTGMKTLEQDVVDKLDELRVHSKGKFQYKIIHMEAANVVDQKAAGQSGESLEEQLQKKGIQPFQVRAIDADEVAVRLIYSSMGLSYKEKPEEIIPQVIPEKLGELEYTIVSKIYRMTLAKNPRVAIVAPYEEKTIEPEVRALFEQLGGKIPSGYKEDDYELLELSLKYEGYDVSRIQLTAEEPIEEGVGTLVVIEPRELNERQKYEISRFLAGGGAVFMAVQNYEYNYAPQGRELAIFPVEKNPGVNSLLKEWGFEVDSRILVDEQHDVINLSGGSSLGPFQMSIPVKIPIQVVVNDSGMNKDVSITSRLSPLFYLWGTALKINESKLKEQLITSKTLLSSSEQSWTVPFKAGSISPDDLTFKLGSPEGPFPLAIMAEGQFADVYSGKEVPKWPALETAAEDGAEAEEKLQSEDSQERTSVLLKPGKLILIGASSFLQKNLVTGGGNLPFYMNSVNALTLGEELVTIKSKQPVNRTLKRISAPAKVGWRFVVTLLIPILIAIIGFLRVFIRKQTKQNYLKVYSKV